MELAKLSRKNTLHALFCQRLVSTEMNHFHRKMKEPVELSYSLIGGTVPTEMNHFHRR